MSPYLHEACHRRPAEIAIKIRPINLPMERIFAPPCNSYKIIVGVTSERVQGVQVRRRSLTLVRDRVRTAHADGGLEKAQACADGRGAHLTFLIGSDLCDDVAGARGGLSKFGATRFDLPFLICHRRRNRQNAISHLPINTRITWLRPSSLNKMLWSDCSMPSTSTLATVPLAAVGFTTVIS